MTPSSVIGSYIKPTPRGGRERRRETQTDRQKGKETERQRQKRTDRLWQLDSQQGGRGASKRWDREFLRPRCPSASVGLIQEVAFMSCMLTLQASCDEIGSKPMASTNRGVKQWLRNQSGVKTTNSPLVDFWHGDHPDQEWPNQLGTYHACMHPHRGCGATGRF